MHRQRVNRWGRCAGEIQRHGKGHARAQPVVRVRQFRLHPQRAARGIDPVVDGADPPFNHAKPTGQSLGLDRVTHGHPAHHPFGQPHIDQEHRPIIHPRDFGLCADLCAHFGVQNAKPARDRHDNLPLRQIIARLAQFQLGLPQ